MFTVRILPVLFSLVIISGCSAPLANGEQAHEGDQPTPAPQPKTPRPLVASPMYVWVPQWGVYVVEGQDIVYYDGFYYYWYGGRWYVSRTHRGPWNHVTDQPPALANLPAGQFSTHLPPGLEKKARPQPDHSD